MVEGPEIPPDVGGGLGPEEIRLPRRRRPLTVGGREALARIADRVGEQVAPAERRAHGRAAVLVGRPPAVHHARHRQRRRAPARGNRGIDPARRVPRDAGRPRRSPQSAERPQPAASCVVDQPDVVPAEPVHVGIDHGDGRRRGDRRIERIAARAQRSDARGRGEHMRRGHHAARRARFGPAGGGGEHGRDLTRSRWPGSVRSGHERCAGTRAHRKQWDVPSRFSPPRLGWDSRRSADRSRTSGTSGTNTSSGGKWVDEQTYADLVALCQFLPGPASSQVGIAARDLPRGPARRARRMARVHAPVGDRADCLRHRRSGIRSLGGRVASWPEGRGGGRRRAGRLGNGPRAVPGSRARDDGPCRRHGRLRVADRVGTGAGDHHGRGCRPATPSPIGRAGCSTHQRPHRAPTGRRRARRVLCASREPSRAPLPHAIPSARGLR